jgi:5-methylcytosine-specific restriction endonuclease McrA
MSFCKFCNAGLPERLPSQKGRKRVYCGKACHDRDKGFVKGVERVPNCLFCGVALEHKAGAGNPKRFCSREHATKTWTKNVTKKAKVSKSCLECQVVFETARDAQVFCSNPCRAANTSAKLKALRVVQEFYEYECDGCSVVVLRKYRVTKGKFGRFCDKCRLRNRRATYRSKTVKRQSLTVKPSRLSCDEIAERDGFMCHICSGVVDMTLPRTRALGGTVDHVVPLSKGGSDDPENLKLAHWVCNVRKGNKIYA